MEQLPLQPERARLIRGDGTAEAAAELLQVLVICVSELLDSDLGRADLGQTRPAEPAENVADAPNREAQRQKPEHTGHDQVAEPMGRGFVDTSEHDPAIGGWRSAG